MTKPKRKIAAKKPEALFGRVVSILEQARGNVVRVVNTNMVLAYWLIGREIVQELQGGAERAEYGKKVVEDLSAHVCHHEALTVFQVIANYYEINAVYSHQEIGNKLTFDRDIEMQGFFIQFKFWHT